MRPRDPPFVLDPPLDDLKYERNDRFDIYHGIGGGPWPAVVFAHGAVPPEYQRPRDCQALRGYGRLAANNGQFAVVPALPYHGSAGTAALEDVLAEIRADPRVDATRTSV